MLAKEHVVSHYKENIWTYDANLLCAKSKGAPLKELTLPSMELWAANLLSQLTDKVIKSINSQSIELVKFKA